MAGRVKEPPGYGEASVTLPRAGGGDKALSWFGVIVTLGEFGRPFEEAREPPTDLRANSNCAPPCLDVGFGGLENWPMAVTGLAPEVFGRFCERSAVPEDNALGGRDDGASLPMSHVS